MERDLTLAGAAPELDGRAKRFAEAKPYFERALAIWEKERGAKHPLLSNPLFGLAEVYLGLNQPKDAIAPFERALALRAANPGDPDELANSRL